MFLATWRETKSGDFINFFPSLLLIKVEIFNFPFYIFGYTLKTKYKNLEFLLKKIPSLLVIKV
jgi:hypothetical protein